MEKLLQLFWIFLKVNLLSTSGPASVGLLYHEAVGKLVTESQFVQAVGLSSVLPGSDALQLAMYVGYALGGIPGGLVALAASILPPTVIILGVTMVLHRLRREAWISNFVEGSGSSHFSPYALYRMEDFSKRRFDGLGGLDDRISQFDRHVSQCTRAHPCIDSRIGGSPLFVMNQSKLSVWLRLLWMFLKVNLLSPSGPASIGLLYKEAVGKIMTEAQFVEAVGFSNVLPGSEALKLAMFVGFAAGGGLQARLERLDVGRLVALGTRRDVEGNLRVLLQALEARALDRGEVREHVRAAAIGGDEAKAFRIVKPLDGSGCHV